MATFSSVMRQHILQAIAEHDARGSDDFRATYGFTDASVRPFLHEGRRYDATAVLGVAHRFATGRVATPEEVTNGLTQALTVLRKRGFEAPVSAPASRPARTSSRNTAGTTPRIASSNVSRAGRSGPSSEAPPAICPSCSMVLPRTGVCDSCG
ncbi:hypothetical protein [Cellulomonas fimi]|uniref:ScoMcrA-like N-terminal head domain-containing protein n=1 Tax=Cellulomonas fimi TaxID=1708 RepID=A0A7Y0LVF5_CELFI|nr:hypothetical protein [Cellulomonas fimi]NMR18669.1 hypothetical protein [Cellulomonas fimi]